MKASVIIPSYNSAERLYLNLLSLNYQDCPKDDFEVIVVDNGSRDDTPQTVLSFKAEFDMKYIRLNSNHCRACARNIGAAYATGEILIFNDSDMINASGYISSHIREHGDIAAAVCGYGWRRIYSYYYREFSGYLRSNFLEQKKKYNIRGSRYKNAESFRLIGENEIAGDQFLKYSFFLDKRQKVLDEVMSLYGKDMKGYSFPWRFFMTNNCSLPRKTFCELDGFDENYVDWGCEDIDLGYRLFKKGVAFRLAPGCISLHQEHPVEKYLNGEDSICYFLDKYNSVDLYMFYYGKYCAEDNLILNEAVREAGMLEIRDGCKELLGSFLRMLKALGHCDMYAVNDKYYRYPKVLSDYDIDELEHSLGTICKAEGMKNFVKVYEGLMKKVVMQPSPGQ